MRPFQMAVQDGGTWGVMASYNRVNGTYAAENRWMLDTVLRGEWGFDGIVVSDWFGARSTGASAIAGLDLEMPGPPRWYGDRLVEAVEAGEVPESVVDGAVRRLLLLAERTRTFEEPHDREERQLDEPAHRSLARRASAEAMVLLKNDRILPLAVDRLASLAVIGPNAATAMVMGGGSATLVAQHETSPLDALVARLGDRLEIRYEPGVVTDRSAQPLGGRTTERADGGRGFDVAYFDSTDWTGPVVGNATVRDGRILHFDRAPGVADLRSFSFRATTTFTPVVDGDHALTLVQAGRARLLVDGQVVVDGIARPMPPGEEFFAMGSAEADAVVTMVAGRPVDVVVEWTSEGAVFLSGVKVGVRTPSPDDLMDRAVAAAATADAVVLVVGTNLDWETEGRDRDSMDLPGGQPELIRRVCAANGRTVVVVNSGSVVTSDWAEVSPAVLQAWFGGQEMADALVDVLVGDDEPSGRLPTTMPHRLEDTPAFLSYPGENGRVAYSEGLFTGYRWYEARRLPVAFPFGHGLGYTSFTWGEPSLGEIPSIAELEAEATVTVTVPVTNDGDRAGSEVVQCYVGPTTPRLTRPVRELQGFAKVRLEPGGSADVVVVLDHRAFAYWDPGDPGHSARSSRVPVAAGQGSGPRDEPGWHVDPGTYELHMGRSSADIRHVVAVDLG
jgi:beta-glucosidase